MRHRTVEPAYPTAVSLEPRNAQCMEYALAVQVPHQVPSCLRCGMSPTVSGESIGIVTDTSLITVSVAFKNALILRNKSNKACNVAENYAHVK